MSKPTTFLTFEEWTTRLSDAAATAAKLIPLVENLTDGPGQTVLALMIAARAVCEAYPALPALEWYFDRVSELRGLVPRDRKTPPS